jgi:hypothetical protein
VDLFQYVYLTEAKTLHKWQIIVRSQNAPSWLRRQRSHSRYLIMRPPARHQEGTDWSLHSVFCLHSEVLNSDDKYHCCRDGWSNEKLSTNLRENCSLFPLLYQAKQAHGIIMSVPVSVSTKERLTTDAFSPHLAKTWYPSMSQMYESLAPLTLKHGNLVWQQIFGGMQLLFM